MTVLATLGVVLLLSFLVETLVEFLFGTIANLIVSIFPNADGLFASSGFKTAIIQLCAIGAGIAGAEIYRFDLLFLLGQFSSLETLPLTQYGVVITGIAIGKGSNYIHQIISSRFPAQD